MTDRINPEELEQLESVDAEAQELTPESLDVLDQQKVTGTKESAAQAGMVAVLKGVPGDEQTIFNAEQELDGRHAATVAAQEYYQKMQADNQEYLRANFANAVTAESVQQAAQQAITEHQAITAKSTSPVATERAVVDALSVNQEDALKEERAFQLAARNELVRMTEEQGLGETILDYAAFALPFGEAVDIHDIKDEIANDQELARQLSADSIEGIVASFQSLPTERKRAIWPAIQSAVIRATSTFGITDGNTTKAAGILLNFLAPEGGEELATQRTLDVALGGIEFIPASKLAKLGKLPTGTKAAMADIAQHATDQLAKETNLVKAAADLGDESTAVSLNLRAMVNEEAAKAAGLDINSARGNAIPQNLDEFTPEQAKGLTGGIAESVNEFLYKAQGFTKSMSNESELLTAGAINQSERAGAVSSWLRRMEGEREDLLNEGIHVSVPRIIKTDSRGIEFEVDIVNNQELVFQHTVLRPGEKPRARPLTQRNVRGRMSWKVNQANGKYMGTVESLSNVNGSTLGLSPSAWAKKGLDKLFDFKEEVTTAIQRADVEGAAQSRVNEMWRDANKTISGVGKGNQRRLLEEIEIEGDEYINPNTQERGRVFTQNELAERGMTNPGTQEAYYKRRVVADQLHAMQNYATRRELEIGGFGMTRVLGQDVLAKMFDTPEAAMTSARNRKGYHVLLQDTKEVVEITDELIEQQYAKGKRLVRTREDFNASGAGDLGEGTRVEYIFINDAGRMRNLPQQVLAYHKGYVPKIQENVEFVVRLKRPIDKPGVTDATSSKPLRAFASKKDADTFIAQQIAHRLGKQGLTPDVEGYDIAERALRSQYETADGSVMSQVERMENALSSSKGLFTGTRAADDLLMGLQGTPIDRMNPSEAFARYMSHIGKVYSKNEWRIGMEQRWMNTVREAQKRGQLAGADVTSFQTTLLPDTPVGKSLEQLRETISHWNGVQTKEESLWQMQVQRMHDWMLNGAQSKFGYKSEVIPAVLNHKQTNIIQGMKTAAMHLFLGVFNPAQLYVQASGATVALSLGRITDVPGVIRQTVHFGMLDNMTRVGREGLDIAIKRLVKDGSITAEDATLYRAWRRSGLRDSVHQNADMHALTTGGNMTWARIKDGFDKGLFLYRMGELVNRRISFLSAARRVGGDISDDATLAKVLEEANKSMLELNTANRAWWQGGQQTGGARQVLGLATQFMQVTAKTVEKIFKGEAQGGFSLKQKGRIALGQTLLFGAAGMPLLNAGSDVMGYMFEDGNVPPEAAATYNQGMVGLVQAMLAGEEVFDMAGRASLLGGVRDTIKDLWQSEDPIWKTLTGINVETGSRAVDALSRLNPLFMGDWVGYQALTKEDIILSLGQIPSSTRNALKGYMLWKSDNLVNRHGRLLIDREFTFGEVAAQSLGFQLTAAMDERMLNMTERERQDLVNETAQHIIQKHHDWVYVHDRDEEHARVLEKHMQVLWETFDDPILMRDVQDLVEKRVFQDPVSREEQNLKRFWEHTAPDEITEGLMIDAGLMEQRAVVRPFDSRTLNEEQE